ncbi:MAG: hypothetical protein AAFU41_09635 [Pseudomonadota bacterium]
MTLIRVAFAALITLPLPAMAEEDWQYNGTFYGWLPGITTEVETPLGEVEAEVAFSDILDKLDFAFLAALEARKGPWALVGDLQYFDLGAETSPQIAAIDTVDVDSQVTILGGYALYEVSNSPDTRIELGGGLRFYDAKFDTVVAGATPLSFSDDGNWADAVLSARVTHTFNNDWFGVAYADVGGFGVGDSSDLTWQAYVAAGYRLNASWSAVAGYRHLMFERDFDGRLVTSDVGGPVIGFQKQF